MVERPVVLSEYALPPVEDGTLYFCDTVIAVRAYKLGRRDVAGEGLGWVLREDAPTTLPAPPTWADL
jgi:hypothetical protein